MSLPLLLPRARPPQDLTQGRLRGCTPSELAVLLPAFVQASERAQVEGGVCIKLGIERD
jgi:hypothetical protein